VEGEIRESQTQSSELVRDDVLKCLGETAQVSHTDLSNIEEDVFKKDKRTPSGAFTNAAKAFESSR
jgi:hypothetical protein